MNRMSASNTSRTGSRRTQQGAEPRALPLTSPIHKTFGISVSDISRDDIDREETIRLLTDSDFNDLVPYLDAGIALDDRRLLPRKPTAPEATPKGYRVVWVENPTTREFVRVEVKNNLAHQSLDSQAPSSGNGTGSNSSSAVSNSQSVQIPVIEAPPSLKGSNTNSELTRISSTRDTNNLGDSLKLTYAFIQGILAGYSFTAVFFQSESNQSNETFLALYQPLSENSRRFFYLLSTIACVGAWDTFMNYYRKRKRSSLDSDVTGVLVLLVVVGIIQTIAFVVNLVISEYDALIADKFGLGSNSSWESLALMNDSYLNDVNNWKRLSLVRLALTLVGWVGFCVALGYDYRSNRRKIRLIDELASIAEAWRARALLMEGQGLESLSAQELSKLRDIQELGLDRIKNIINLAQERERRPTVTIPLSPTRRLSTFSAPVDWQSELPKDQDYTA